MSMSNSPPWYLSKAVDNGYGTSRLFIKRKNSNIQFSKHQKLKNYLLKTIIVFSCFFNLKRSPQNNSARRPFWTFEPSFPVRQVVLHLTGSTAEPTNGGGPNQQQAARPSRPTPELLSRLWPGREYPGNHLETI